MTSPGAGGRRAPPSPRDRARGDRTRDPARVTIRLCISLPGGFDLPALTAPWERALSGRELLRIAREADALGFESLKVPEHYVVPASAVDTTGSFYLHASTAQAFLAGGTERIRLNTGVTLLPLVSPLVTAKALATLDFLSGGRAEVTFGLGTLEGEYEAFGVSWAARGERADEFLAAIRVLHREPVAHFEGRHVSFRDVVLDPKPIARRLPIHLGGDADAVLRRAARFADGWTPWRTPLERIPERLDFLKSRPGFDGRPFEVCYSVAGLAVGADHAATGDAQAALRGSVDEVVDRLSALAELGVTQTVIANAPVDDLEGYLDHLRWLAQEVRPRLDGGLGSA